MLTQEPLFLTRVLGKKSWPKKGSGRRGILWKIHGNPWRIRENPWNINGKSAEIYGESAGIHWKSLENLWKSIIKQALFGYSLLAMVPTFAACASFARGLTFATGPTGSNLCNRSENEIQCRVQLHFSCPAHWLGPAHQSIQESEIWTAKNEQFLVLTLVILLHFWVLRGPWPLLATKK